MSHGTGADRIQFNGTLVLRRVPEECPQAIADLVAQCMEPEPAVRPSARDLVALLTQPDLMLDRHLMSHGGGVINQPSCCKCCTTQFLCLVLLCPPAISQHSWNHMPAGWPARRRASSRPEPPPQPWP